MNMRSTSLCALGCIALPLVTGTALAALPNYSPPAANQMRVHYVDVGQGAAVLLEFNCGSVLIDTGGEKHEHFDSTARLKSYLDAYFARRLDRERTIDLLILTHAHIDHTRGVPTVLGNYRVLRIVDNGLETGSGGAQQKAAHAAVRASNGAIKYQAVAEKMITDTAGMTNDVIDPIKKCAGGTDPKIVALWGALDRSRGWTQTVMKNGNNSSVVVRLDFGKAAFLFPGDLEDEVQGDLLEFYSDGCTSNCMLDVDVYQVSHHGSRNGTNPELIGAMKDPKIAAISMGSANRLEPWTAHAYGHPRKSVIDELLIPVHGVSMDRPPRTVSVALRAESKRKPRAGAPPLGEQFVDMQMRKAIYGTGWDGTVVVTAQSDGKLEVDTEK
jgi:beta-lactamase superfamily II metal-dependent hydrolase